MTTTEYNSIGKVSATIDAYGRRTEMLYDVRGNLIETRFPDDTVSAADNPVTRTVYDAKGRPIWQQERAVPNASGVTTAPATSTEYDAAGRVVKVKKYAAISMRKANMIAKTGADVVTDSLTQYRQKSAVASVTHFRMELDPPPTNGYTSITRTAYDAAGRVQFTMDTRGTITEYIYDVAGRRTKTRLAKTPLTGNLDEATLTSPSAAVETEYGYDPNGNQKWVEDGLGRRTEFEYDAMNRLVATRFPLTVGQTVQAERRTRYDQLGRRVLEMDEAGVLTGYGYDALGRLISVTNDFSGSDPLITQYGYDSFGNLVSQTDARSQTTTFGCDALGRRTRRVLPDATSYEAIAYSKQQVSGLSAYVLRKVVRDFRGRTLTFDYDLCDRLLKLTPSATDSSGQNVALSERTTVDYTYTPSGHRALVSQSGGTARDVRYAYDTSGRLRVKETPEGTLTYSYDAAGAVTRISARTSYGNWQGPPFSFEALTQESVDENQPEWNYQYDSLGRLVKVNADTVGGVWVKSQPSTTGDLGFTPGQYRGFKPLYGKTWWEPRRNISTAQRLEWFVGERVAVEGRLGLRRVFGRQPQKD